jgi:flagellar biosynthesis/type III secretory pathway M-ring protein FliF/YscJ
MLALLQLPAPPAPPGGSLTVGGDLSDPAAVLIVLASLATAIIVLWPLVRALARRLEARGPAAELDAEMNALRRRLDELEQGQSRVAELEERVDFAERLLAQHRDTDRLPR